MNQIFNLNIIKRIKTQQEMNLLNIKTNILDKLNEGLFLYL